jgi:hypothetical protein
MTTEIQKDQLEKLQHFDVVAPLHFLLTCSDISLDNFEISKLSEAANARTKLHEDLDRWFDLATQAALVRLFRAQGRERILKALQEPPDPIAEAKAKIRNMGRPPEEVVPVLSLPPGQAHRTASATYQQRNIEEGKCCICLCPLAPNSVRYCKRHLAVCRDRARANARAKKPSRPATAEVCL